MDNSDQSSIESLAQAVTLGRSVRYLLHNPVITFCPELILCRRADLRQSHWAAVAQETAVFSVRSDVFARGQSSDRQRFVHHTRLEDVALCRPIPTQVLGSGY